MIRNFKITDKSSEYIDQLSIKFVFQFLPITFSSQRLRKQALETLKLIYSHPFIIVRNTVHKESNVILIILSYR